MTVVVSQATLLDMPANWWPLPAAGSLNLYLDYTADYATIYRTQPNVRTCVDFLARNIAQLGLHVFRRKSDTDRERLTDHGLVQVLGRPLPAEYKVTRYRLIETLVGDLGVYFNAYWLKLRVDGAALGLLRVPPPMVTVHGGWVPTAYKITWPDGRVQPVQPAEIVHFRGYSAENAVMGLSPLETLRRVLAEEHAAGDYREHFWQNAARMGGIVERPAEAPEWSDVARNRFREEFGALYSGGESSGTTAVLEDGMTWKPASFNAQQSEYLQGRKLTREECARAYHIPLPLVGILDNATFSNIREQHKHLYQDSLGPWLAMIEQEIGLQLLPEFADSDGVYCEFNIAEKLQGSFEEQTQSMQSAVGRAWMTPNEARARLNLPRIDEPEADLLGTPLNVLVGGQASPRDSAPKGAAALLAMALQIQTADWLNDEQRERLQARLIDEYRIKAAGIDSHRPELRAAWERRWAQVLARHYRRQEAAIVSRVPAKSDIGGVWWDDERWIQELFQDLFGLNAETALAWAQDVAGELGAEVSPERMEAWLKEHSRIQSEYLNDQVREAVTEALRAEDPLQAVKDVFALAVTSWAAREAVSAVTSAANFGSHEGANAGGLRTKTWVVNSSNPRDTHLRMDGETVGIRDRFSNGMRWPGDPAGGAEENANCRCSVRWGR